MKTTMLLKLTKREKESWERVLGKGKVSATIRELMNVHCRVAGVGLGLPEAVQEASERLELIRESKKVSEVSVVEPAAQEEDVPWEQPEVKTPRPKFTDSRIVGSFEAAGIVRPKDQQAKVDEIKSVLAPKGTYRRKDLCQRCQRFGAPACEMDKKKFAGKTLLS